jgi:hypothetical protein
MGPHASPFVSQEKIEEAYKAIFLYLKPSLIHFPPVIFSSFKRKVNSHSYEAEKIHSTDFHFNHLLTTDIAGSRNCFAVPF